MTPLAEGMRRAMAIAPHTGFPQQHPELPSEPRGHDLESVALQAISTELQNWSRETGGWRILTTGPGKGVCRASVLVRLAETIVTGSPLGVLLVEGQDVVGLDADISAPMELIPGRVWFVPAATFRHLPESQIRPVRHAGSPEPALLVLVDGGAWDRLDGNSWLHSGIMDAVLDIRTAGDQSEDARLDMVLESEQLPLLGFVEVPPQRRAA
ncbi:MAG TPA: hypothetical protein DDY91_19720 [Planctomycetaceae bacterium]|nr:hypothetical protein [Planctomycetaceae bacterium]